MEARESLLSMGFAPDRVDWALRETPPDADLQARVDHLIQHEGEHVPTSKSLGAAGSKSEKVAGDLYIYSPPAYAPPSSLAIEHKIQSEPSGSITPAQLAESLNGLRIQRRTPDPLSLSIENESVARYAEFLSAERGRIIAAHSNQEIAEDLLVSISNFFNEERKRWQQVLHPSKPTPQSVNADNNAGTSSNGNQSQASNENRLSTNATEAEMAQKSAVYDAIATYDSTRPLLPPLESVKRLLNGIVTKFTERESVENARKRAGEICTQMEKQVSDLRWQTTVTGSSMSNESSLPSSDDMMSQLLAMQSTGDYRGAARFAQDYSRREAAMKEQQMRTAAEEYRRSYLDPATAAVNKAISESQPIYAEIQTHLENNDKHLDVVKTIRALEQVSSNIECGMKLLEQLDDEKSAQEIERRVKEAMNRQQFREASQLETQKVSRVYEVNAVRTSQRVARRAHFFNLAISRINKALSDIDNDQSVLKAQLKELLGTIPETISLDQEEARARAGDTSPSKIPLPSKELFNQISDAQSSLISINATAFDLRTLLKEIQRQQVEERAESDMAQFTLRETRAGRWTNLYGGPGKQLRDRANNELAELERAFDGFRRTDLTELDAITGPVNTFLSRYKAREALVMQRLAMGGPPSASPTPTSSSYFASGGTGGVNPTIQAFQRLFQQQYTPNQSY
ncbi:SubName: Full=Uncharacterized protein {ECO:0000313/EMBL:CCA68029.1} [Serendipita indica DSM 11827]|nr:SubName: Full=Uncharacterized protein {ECO:0000313/EMBL:CCA68029.1} [Serendipita indica DSM 11827]